MKRREFMSQTGIASLLVGTASESFGSLSSGPDANQILLPTLAHPLPSPKWCSSVSTTELFPSKTTWRRD
jgi:hypothetical protein